MARKCLFNKILLLSRAHFHFENRFGFWAALHQSVSLRWKRVRENVCTKTNPVWIGPIHCPLLFVCLTSFSMVDIFICQNAKQKNVFHSGCFPRENDCENERYSINERAARELPWSTHQLTLPLPSSSSVTAISNSTTHHHHNQQPRKKTLFKLESLLNMNSMLPFEIYYYDEIYYKICVRHWIHTEKHITRWKSECVWTRFKWGFRMKWLCVALHQQQEPYPLLLNVFHYAVCVCIVSFCNWRKANWKLYNINVVWR